jgi:hypothetical protein
MVQKVSELSLEKIKVYIYYNYFLLNFILYKIIKLTFQNNNNNNNNNNIKLFLKHSFIVRTALIL